MVADLGCSSHQVPASKAEFKERMWKLVGYRGQPIATVSYYVHSFLSEAIAASGFKVVFLQTHDLHGYIHEFLSCQLELPQLRLSDY